MAHSSFPLRLHAEERNRGRRLADELGISENRLYAELIHDGLLIREQAQYMERLRMLAAVTSRNDALAILDQVPDTPPIETDRLDETATRAYSESPPKCPAKDTDPFIMPDRDEDNHKTLMEAHSGPAYKISHTFRRPPL